MFVVNGGNVECMREFFFNIQHSFEDNFSADNKKDLEKKQVNQGRHVLQS